MKNTLFVGLSVLVLIAASGIGKAEACSCFGSSIEEAVAEADAVFSGKVERVSGESGTIVAVFEVAWVWKGGVKKKTTISAGSLLFCGYWFKAGENYLVYSSAGKTSVCTRTKILSESERDLLKLGRARKPAE